MLITLKYKQILWDFWYLYADGTRIYQWGFREYGETAADEYYSAFFDRFEQLAEQPYLYQAVDDVRKGYRKSVCGVDMIYYRVIGDMVEIMNVLGRQDRDEWL